MDVCGQSINNFSPSSSKQISQTPEDPSECIDFSDEFIYRSALTQHLLIHIRKKPHISQHYGESLSEDSFLGGQNQMHTRGKLCECHLCGKAFDNCYSLRSHEMTHTEEKPFKCHICGKDFLQSFDLRNHNRIHTGEKLYEYHPCGKVFS